MTAGSRTLKDAINEAMRDWVTNVETTHYLLGTVAGPAPVPDDGARLPAGDRRQRPAQQVLDLDRPPAGRRVRVRRWRVERDRHLPRLPRRPRGAAVRAGGRRRRRRDRPARGLASPVGYPACCTGRGRTCCRTRTARPSRATPSPPGWTTRASDPSTPGCTTAAGRATSRSPTPRRWTPSPLLCRTEGIIPAIESAHALAGAIRVGRRLGPDGVVLVNLSGRGRQGRRHGGPLVRARGDGGGAVSVEATLAAARAEGRAALIGYLPVGFPDLATLHRGGACAGRGRASTSSRSACRTPTR